MDNITKNKLLKLHKAYVVGLLFALFAVFASIFLPYVNPDFLRTSMAPLSSHLPFNGTVYPVKMVPNWVNLSSEKWNAHYSALLASELISIPYYDPSVLSKPVESLEWGNSAHNDIRNAKITYSVPYMGNYFLDGKEYAGSHLAVDIKIPMGTPIYAMANGTVVKAVEQNSGFGHHIVLQHDNFPTLENPNARTQLFSSYSHLGSLLVKSGEIVVKGQQIGLSGNSGTATTPHLHFQLDNSNAPWHPFWPFTWSEAVEAGLDFFSAVNAGLGAEVAKQTTINPLKYVQVYLDNDSNSSATYYAGSTVSSGTAPKAGSYINSNNSYISVSGSTDSGAGSDWASDSSSGLAVGSGSEATASSVESLTTDALDSADTVDLDLPSEIIDTDYSADEASAIEPSVFAPTVFVDEKYLLEKNNKFSVSLTDQFGKFFQNGFTGELIVTSVNSLIKIDNPILTFRNFDRSGLYGGSFSIKSSGRERLKLIFDGTTIYSDWFKVEKSEYKNPFNDLKGDEKYYEAVLYLNFKDIIKGYPNGDFRPNNLVNRVEALKFIIEGVQISLKKGASHFSDLSPDDWYSKYVYTALDEGIVVGYADGTFKPSQSVNKAEFYKMLFLGMGVAVPHDFVSNPFSDVDSQAWYAPYVIHAYDLGIIDSNVSVLRPERPMTRGEVAYAIYKLLSTGA